MMTLILEYDRKLIFHMLSIVRYVKRLADRPCQFCRRDGLGGRATP